MDLRLGLNESSVRGGGESEREGRTWVLFVGWTRWPAEKASSLFPLGVAEVNRLNEGPASGERNRKY